MPSTRAAAWLPDLLREDLRAQLERARAGGGERLLLSSLSPTSRLLTLAAAARGASRALLVVTSDDREARALVAPLSELLGEGADEGAGAAAPEEGRVVRLPATDADPYRGMPAHPTLSARRVRALDRLAAGEPLVLVAPIAALLVPVPTPASMAAAVVELARGDTIDVAILARRALRLGYRVVDVVGAPGELARRGGIVDVWPPSEPAPIRLELFDDELESLRRFDAASQRTIEPVERFRMPPAREAPIDPDAADRLLDRFLGRAREILLDDEGPAESLTRAVEERLAGLEAAPRLYRDDLVPLASHPALDLVAWGAEGHERALEIALEELERAHAESVAQGGVLPPPAELYEDTATILAALGAASLAFGELPISEDPARRIVDLGGRPPRRPAGELSRLPTLVREAVAAGRPVVLLARAPGQRQRLVELLESEAFPLRLEEGEEPWPPGPGEVVVCPGSLAEGVELGESGALLLSESDVFGAEPAAAPPPRRRKRREGAFLSDFRDLKPGDLVVHVDHGVARYVGLKRREATGEELLELEYAARDKLFVPVARLDLVQKYSGGESRLVPLDRLGGQGWDKRRKRVGQAVERIAGELLALYAERRAIRAPAFGDDSTWQREFEAAFPHRLTEDQVAALEDCKRDLASGRPMDRLLCGDVGYGKTEVALRAAFKVVEGGQQVAVLVPTTVLAFQHLATFRARMAAWPVRIEMVSRFASAAEVRERLEAARRGEIDILVGTHRLLSKDVSFKRLGLLIIDEEQRFGVRHKERIKQLSKGVHVLAMSATPIPRTLQMSLAGVRDLSVIETPPRNRLAIQTRLVPRSLALVGDAIRRELRRGGQVYVVHPKIEGLESFAAKIREEVPEAAIAVAHGQLPERGLEEVMLSFVRGEAQVLVATTIVENGLDISRANTIVVNDAQRFGLSQLYQMRGRVGRSDQRAYAYLLVPPRRELSEDARKRLSALVEFSDLGAGFRIAALDLEIRGAGEFLGARQSGHIASVGFEMYIGMLERAVSELKGEALEHAPEPVAINLGVAASLPEDLVPDPGQRLAIYKRLAAAESEAEIDDIAEEAEDRYGRLPRSARDLFRLARLRLVAAAQGAVSIDWAEGAIALRYGERPRVDAAKIVDLMQKDENVRMTSGGILRLRIPDARADRIAAASLALRKLVS